VLEFEVAITDDAGESTHRVTIDPSYFERLRGSDEDPAEFVERCFRFLLAREPKESLLSTFDVSVIGRYFTEFEDEIAR
jgi:hypothetical protein